jgi:hypothetical protein
MLFICDLLTWTMIQPTCYRVQGSLVMQRRTMQGLFAIMAVAISAATPAAEYRMLAGWDRSFQGIPHVVEPFIRNVEAASKGNIKIVLSGPEAVPPFEQLQACPTGESQQGLVRRPVGDLACRREEPQGRRGVPPVRP